MVGEWWACGDVVGRCLCGASGPSVGCVTPCCRGQGQTYARVNRSAMCERTLPVLPWWEKPRSTEWGLKSFSSSIRLRLCKFQSNSVAVQSPRCRVIDGLNSGDRASIDATSEYV